MPTAQEILDEYRAQESPQSSASEQILAEYRQSLQPAQQQDIDPKYSEYVKRGQRMSETAEMITGEQRKTPDIEGLPEVTSQIYELAGPELQKAAMKIQGGMLLADSDEERAAIIQEQIPDATFDKNEETGVTTVTFPNGKKAVINRPGFSYQDVENVMSDVILFLGGGGIGSGLGRAAAGQALKRGLIKKAPGAIAKAGGIGIAEGTTEAARQQAQEELGGTFDPADVGLATAIGFTTAAAPGIVRGGIEKFRKPGAKEAIETAEQLGVTPMTSDIFPPETFTGKTAQAITERIPVAGTGAKRMAQQETREQAVKQVLSDYGVDDVVRASDDVTKDLLKKRSADIEKYTSMKNEVIDRLSKDTVPVSKTTSVIDKEIGRLTALENKDLDPLISALEDAKTSFSGKNLSQFEANRKIFGEKLKSTDLATVKSEAQKVDRKIYKAVNDDMGDYIKAAGEPRDFNKWKVANKRLSTMMEGLKTTSLKSVLKKGNQTPEEVRKLLFSKKPSDIKTLYRNLTPQGKSRARVAILQEAADKAGGFEEVSTAKFLSSLKKLEDSTGVFFKGQDKKVLEGLKKTLELTKRAEVSGLQPPTGLQNFQLIGAFGLGTLAGGAKGAAAAASAGAIARVYESKFVRNFLINVANGKTNSPQATKRFKKIIDKTLKMYGKPAAQAARAKATED